MIQSQLGHRREVQKSPQGQRIVSADGELIHVPEDWVFVASGAPALDRLLAAGPGWRVVSTRGNSRFTTGIWVPPGRLKIETQGGLSALLADRVLGLLDFPPRHQKLAEELAQQIAQHLAQQQLPDEGRSLSDADLELALLEWLAKHVGSDAGMTDHGAHFRDRWQARALAILAEYRVGLPRDPHLCPLARALALTAERC